PNSPLNSALQLAANERLTARDVIDHVHLQCKLVILSACESGLSRVRRGDELLGLVRAFLYAGTSMLLCTLWRVDDRSTHILMGRFYQEILQGTPFGEALRRAQRYLMQLTPRQLQELDRSSRSGDDDLALSLGNRKNTKVSSAPLLSTMDTALD